MSVTVICLSHADGALGREVGQCVADALGFRYADEEIVMAAAREKGLYPESVALAETRGVGRSLEVDFGRHERTETLRDLIRGAVGATAAEGSVVIVAHAASYALAGRNDVLRVLVTASPDTRAARLAAAGGLNARGADKELAESDKGRAAYLQRFYGVNNELPSDYDLVLNTDRLLPAAAAAVIVDVAAALSALPN